jgi:hypothetical protein
MVSDPNNAQFVIASSPLGVYVSIDGGFAWTLRATGLDASFVSSQTNSVLSVSSLNGQRVLWAGFTTGSVYQIYHSVDDGLSWTRMDMTGVVLGPQGDPNFCILGDPTNLDFVYIGGTSYQNIHQIAILLRGSRSKNSWTPITGAGTASNSGPHVDTRFLVWDYKTGDLVNTNDGGVYIRTKPQTSLGDWFARNGDLAILEALSADVDPNNGVLVVCAQDNVCSMSNPADSAQKLASGGALSGRGFPGGDGGYLNVDSTRGIYYLPSQKLAMPWAQVSNFATQDYQYNFDFSGTLLSGGTIAPFQPYIVMNTQDSTKLFVCVSSPARGCFELIGHNKNTVVTPKISGTFYETYVYGGVTNNVADAQMLFAVSGASQTSSPLVYQRTSANLNPTAIAGSSEWGSCVGLSVNPFDYTEAVVGCGQSGSGNYGSDMWYSSNFGTNWAKVTGNLLTASGAGWDFRPQCSAIVPLADSSRAYLVGCVLF